MFLLLLVQMAFAQEDLSIPEPPILDPPTETEADLRSERLGKMLRCPVCQGLSVADSRSDAAIAMQNRIRDFVLAGYSDDQIVDYFVSRYGEWALLKPKSSHWFVWTAPGVGLLFGFGVVGWQIRQRKSKLESPTGRPLSQNESATVANANDSYRQRILDELDGEQ